MALKILKDIKKIALDTMVFVYFFEGRSSYVTKIENLFKKVEAGSCQAFTTVITLSEILVKPLADKNIDLADEYKNVINSFPNLQVLEINQYLATLAANLKAKYKIKLPDALQLAGALVGGAELFVTNDKKLTKIKEVKIVTLDKLH